MAILRIKPNMIEPLPGDKIPEIVEARAGSINLNSRLKNVDAQTIRGYVPINKNGDNVEGQLILSGGAVVPKNAVIDISGDAQFKGPISMVSSATTAGTYGVSAVVANVYENTLQPVLKAVQSYDDVVNNDNTQIIVDYQPLAIGNFLAYIYFRVNSQITNVSLTLTYQDIGGQQQISIMNDETCDIGSYSMPAIFFNAVPDSPILLKAKSDIPNQLYVSASIIGL